MKFKKISLSNMSPSRAKARNLVFVDKTRYIDWLENDLETEVPVFLRPRRFGKTFFTVLLKNYYDISLRDHFDENFEGTWIHSHKTAEANSYYCLKLDFSDVSSEPGKVQDSFAFNLSVSLGLFSSIYPDKGLPQEKLDPKLYGSPAELMAAFLGNFAAKAQRGDRLYIIIDEYDHYADEVLSRDKEEFKKITSTAGGNDGFIKQFYACLKKFFGGSEDAPIARFFITGVSSVSLDSMTSGFNIATDISGWNECSAMVGLTHDELSDVVDESIDFSCLNGVGKTELMDTMERQFDGYLFSEKGKRVFNTSMCLNFLYDIRRQGWVGDSLSSSIITEDVKKLEGVMRLTDPKTAGILSDQIFKREKITSLRPEKLNLNQTGHFDLGMTVSMLKYLGYLSLAQGNSFGSGMLMYQCPNEVYYRIFIRYLENRMSFPRVVSVDLHDMASAKADISPLLKSVERVIGDLPETGFAGVNEKGLQLCFDFAVRADPGGSLVPCLEFDTGERGRADMVVYNRNPGGRNFLFELKYLPKSKCTDAAVAAKLAEAREQLEHYRKSPKLKAIPRLDCWAVVFSGDKSKAAEKI